MADVTVGELAKVVGVTAERLLAQIKEAGLPHKRAEEPISNEDKNALLLFLRRSHGAAEAGDSAPKKITLKRKTVGTLKTSSGQGRGKTVNVEVRKKRTYVKRSELEPEKPAEEAVIADDMHEQAPPPEAVVEQPPETTAKVEDAASAEAAPVAAEDDVKPSAKATPDENVGKDDTADVAAAATAEQVEAARAAKTGQPSSGKPKAPVKTGRKDDADEKDDDKKSGFRKKSAAPKKQGKARISADDFVLEDNDSDDAGGRGRRGGPRRKPRRQQHGFEKPTEFISREIIIGEANTVPDLAQKMSLKSAELIKSLFKMGVMATINQVLDQDTATLLVEEFGHTAKFVSADAIEDDLYDSIAYDGGAESVSRAPVVTVMGHVDHGKTSLLDYIRKSSVASGEAGGITQHIGAYHVETDHGMICFLDTPGHAAFSAMRSRGAKATDVVVLVVAADDGMKPQTEEAIQHARAAGVPIVVAITKVDKEDIDIDKVTSELAAKDVIPESWGGDTMFVQVSAHTGAGINELLEAILLQSEMLELKAFIDASGKGVVIESRLDKGRGPVASVLVQNGTLNVGDVVLAGHEYGRVRALIDEAGRSVKSAGPSIPVEVLGFNGVPEAGDEFVVVVDEKKAKEVAEFRLSRHKDHKAALQQGNKVEAMFAGLGRAGKGILNVIIKSDVRGSMEAIIGSLQKIGTEEVEVNVVASGVGGISETDAHLAATSKAMLIGFNVRADKTARDVIENEGVNLRYYNVIYDVIDDVKAILGGMLAPELREEILGVAEVRDVFNSPKFGQVAGCMVVEGSVFRNRPIRVLRDNVVIYEGELESLRRFKDDANEVRNGMECGIGVKNYNDVKVGDKIEVYQTIQVARSL
ncbi:translation initiation factor IF-2 [Pseudohongiella sp.]|uniref:Tr-type G domain-containing protein n=1 Tax=marine sediment metagenome TaxID=412755 RepID=A0A0F9W3W8_9ZZZZ|nr:translation initiation factor IF-2 [Pseudohongiella sp.]HDZ10126.1 translation initiation factor IF-2 [Pseudohongiella sp.]HEA63475.1 translation initiation factor IF-2 [Pseudohongiella sp.]